MFIPIQRYKYPKDGLGKKKIWSFIIFIFNSEKNTFVPELGNIWSN